MKRFLLLLCLGCSSPEASSPPASPTPGTWDETYRCPSELNAPEKQALLDRFTGTYPGLVGRVGYTPHCPESAPIEVEVTVSPPLDATYADEKPCDGLVRVILEVSSSDGTLDAACSGWLTEQGIIGCDEITVQLPSGLLRGLHFQAPGTRSVDRCCAVTLTAEQLALVPATLRTGLQRVTFADIAGKTHQNEIEVVIVPAPPRNDCGDTTATFELLSAAGKRVAAGSGSLVFGFRTCPEGGSCGHIQLAAGATTEDQAGLLGYDAAERITTLGGLISAQVVQGKLQDVRISFEISCASRNGITMSAGGW